MRNSVGVRVSSWAPSYWPFWRCAGFQPPALGGSIPSGPAKFLQTSKRVGAIPQLALGMDFRLI